MTDFKNPFSNERINDILPFNVVSPEIYNLLLLCAASMLVLWMARLCKNAFSLSQLSIALRNSQLISLVNIEQFERIQNIWGEDTIRNYLQSLFRGRVKSPSVMVSNVLHHSIIQKSSIKVVKNASNNGLYDLTFKFDCSRKCIVQLFWGVTDKAMNDKFLPTFIRRHPNVSSESSTDSINHHKLHSSSSSSLMKEKQKLYRANVNSSPSPLLVEDRNLLLVTEIDTDSNMNHSYPVYTTYSHTGLNDILVPEDYLKKTTPLSFDPGNSHEYHLLENEMISSHEHQKYLLNLPFLDSVSINASSPTSVNDQHTQNEQHSSDTNSRSTRDENSEVDESSPIQLQKEKKHNKSGDFEKEFENKMDSICNIPLIISIMMCSSSNTSHQVQSYDDETTHEYCLVYFRTSETKVETTKMEKQPNTSGESSEEKKEKVFVANIYKHLIQTKKLYLYELQEVYGGGEDSGNNANLDEEDDCVICLCEPKEITLLPCRHLCVCSTCFQQIDKCPICRKPLDAYLSIPDGGDTSKKDISFNNNLTV